MLYNRDMSRKSKRPTPKPSRPKQSLPFSEKVVPDLELSKKGLTDKFHRFNGSLTSALILREVCMPGGNVYQNTMTSEKIALREKELKKYAETASMYDISVVSHIDFLARRTANEPIAAWTIANKVPGNITIHDLFNSNDPKAFEYQKRVMRASVEYCISAAKDESSNIVVTDLLKPSQFMVSEGGKLTMIDTNPPLWDRSRGIDSTLSEVFIMGMAINVLEDDLEAVDIGIEAIQSLADTGLINGSINAVNTTNYVLQNYAPDHPQTLLMQRVGLDLLLERPIE